MFALLCVTFSLEDWYQYTLSPRRRHLFCIYDAVEQCPRNVNLPKNVQSPVHRSHNQYRSMKNTKDALLIEICQKRKHDTISARYIYREQKITKQLLIEVYRSVRKEEGQDDPGW